MAEVNEIINENLKGAVIIDLLSDKTRRVRRNLILVAAFAFLSNSNITFSFLKTVNADIVDIANVKGAISLALVYLTLSFIVYVYDDFKLYSTKVSGIFWQSQAEAIEDILLRTKRLESFNLQLETLFNLLSDKQELGRTGILIADQKLNELLNELDNYCPSLMKLKVVVDNITESRKNYQNLVKHRKWVIGILDLVFPYVFGIVAIWQVSSDAIYFLANIFK